MWKTFKCWLIKRLNGYTEVEYITLSETAFSWESRYLEMVKKEKEQGELLHKCLKLDDNSQAIQIILSDGKVWIL